MTVSETVYRRLLACPAVPPECGVLLGGRDGVVTHIFFDEGRPALDRAVYTPDAARLNDCLRQWSAQGLSMLGLAHTHPLNQPSLSEADRDYIRAVFMSNPAAAGELFFPIVLPEKEIIAYRATRRGADILIEPDALHVVPTAL